MKITLNSIQESPEIVKSALWQLGFRPCFLVANLHALIIMLMWLMIQQGAHFPGLDYYGINFWHAHEMVFAYSMMVIAGFLLTAIKNWTGIQTVQGKQLMILVGSWVLSRLMIFIPGVPPIWMMVVDSIFPLLLIIFVALPLIKVANRRNYMMIVMVGIMALINGLFHYSVFNHISSLSSKLILFMLLIVIVLITVMAGRVFAMFSQNGVPKRYQAKVYPLIEKSLPIITLIFAVIWVFFQQFNILVASLALINFILHGWRLFGWYNHQIWQKPLVWVLHVGYFFMVLAFIIVAISTYLNWFHFLAIHLFTTGGLAMITMGMMARVSFGHTGRNLHQPPGVLVYCFILLTLAAITRVFLPMVSTFTYPNIIIISGLLWIMAFGLFVARYFPIWVKPRVDGKPG